ncbi:MAG: sugar phosphate isomerase/epimerase family protein [Armatimonadota bacterium]
MTERRFSCREGVYPSWQDAVRLLPEAGVRGIEINQRPPQELDPLAAGVRAGGLEVTSLSTHVDLDSDDSVTAYVAQLEAAGRLGIGVVFTSASGRGRESTWYMHRLADLADEADMRGVVMALETHPPFCMNADTMLGTISAIDRPNVGVNFDTANIYYYNRGLDSADQLAKVAQHVVSLHLKDTDGGYESFEFPVLGQGVVDFPRIFAILDEAGFDGPLTLELEGPITSGKSLQERHEAVLACMEYLRSIGVA